MLMSTDPCMQLTTPFINLASHTQIGLHKDTHMHMWPQPAHGPPLCPYLPPTLGGPGSHL